MFHSNSLIFHAAAQAAHVRFCTMVYAPKTGEENRHSNQRPLDFHWLSTQLHPFWVRRISRMSEFPRSGPKGFKQLRCTWTIVLSNEIFDGLRETWRKFHQVWSQFVVECWWFKMIQADAQHVSLVSKRVAVATVYSTRTKCGHIKSCRAQNSSTTSLWSFSSK